ncbi:MAG: lysophospholipid acyltransferase family protein [Planctomycetota bacterium]
MRKRIEYVFYRAFAVVIPLLPRWLMVFIGRRLGYAYYLFDQRVRNAGRENLARFLPDADSRFVLREGARLQAVALMDALWARRLTPDRARKVMEISQENERRLQAARDGGRGMVLATAHFGSWEMLNVAAGAMGLPRATVVAREIRNPHVDKHLRRQRESTGNIIAYRKQAVMACLSALKKGELVCSVIDMSVLPAEGGLFADFFGLPVMTSGTLPFFAHRRKAPLYFIVAVPLDKGMRYRLEATPIPIDYDNDRNEEVAKAVATMNALLEEYVRKQPEAWVWGYKRWKWRPAEHRGPYPSYSYWVTKKY